MNRCIIALLLCAMTTPAYAGGGGYASQSLNFALLLAGLIFLGSKVVPTMLENRAKDIKNEIEKGQKDLEIATARNEELQAQLNELDQKIAAIHEQADKDIAFLTEKIRQQTEEEQQRINETTSRSIEEELRRAKYELKQESAELAIQLAAELLEKNISADDQKKLTTVFVETIKEGGVNV